MKSNDFAAQSYQRHTAHYDAYARSGDKADAARNWMRDDTVDAWRHHRMYHCVDPLLEQFPGAAWITVGDGRYGTDAHYLNSRGAKAIATDISVSLLGQAKDLGYIRDYAAENAEQLSYAPDRFDFALCKESYHHFPRPMLALYEMLRVSSTGVVLIEPPDAHSFSGFGEAISGCLKNAAKSVLGYQSDRHQFEDSGNYVYGISRREIEKAALGLNLSVVAYKPVNVPFLKRIEGDAPARPGSMAFRKIRAIAAVMDTLTRLGLWTANVLVAVIFKTKPDQAVIQALRQSGYEILELPRNPYI